jgi:phosphotransferase system HPr-like phosphotransfer protein
VLDVEAVGEKAADAVSQIGELIENRFGEPD